MCHIFHNKDTLKKKAVKFSNEWEVWIDKYQEPDSDLSLDAASRGRAQAGTKRRFRQMPHPECQVQQEAQAAGNRMHKVERETPMLMQGDVTQFQCRSPTSVASSFPYSPLSPCRYSYFSLCSDLGPTSFLELLLVFPSQKKVLFSGTFQSFTVPTTTANKIWAKCNLKQNGEW